MNAATRPAIGAVRSSSSRRAPRRQIDSPPAATTPAASDTGASMNPSGTCTALPPLLETFPDPVATGTQLQVVCNKGTTGHRQPAPDRLPERPPARVSRGSEGLPRSGEGTEGLR